MKNTNLEHALAASITKTASKQTYYTIRFLADRERMADAYRAYAYFRWVDDTLDADPLPGSSAGKLESPERHAFIERQEAVLDNCYRGKAFEDLLPAEEMLVRLVQNDTENDSGLQFYLRNMMAVMAFDARRRGRLISQAELNEYTRWLAGGVTEAMHYFIGHGCHTPRNEARYLAVTAAHITHMLRDTFDDIQAGYFNIPREVLDGNPITALDVHSSAYRDWVKSRVDLARLYFERGREYLRQVENPRCRLAGFAYTARFEWLLDTIARENYCLRSQYNERKSMAAGLRMSWIALAPMLQSQETGISPHTVPLRGRSVR